MRLTKREARARMQLIQEMHLDKHGQHVIDTIHRDLGTPYADMYAAYHTARGFKYALRSIIDGTNAWFKAAARTIGGNFARGLRASTFRVNSMEVGPRDVYIRADVYPELPPMEVNVQIIKEAAP